MKRFQRTRALGLALLLVVATGCASGSGTLGGREKCWPDTYPRSASLWRGTLAIDAFGGTLKTPEGDAIPLRAGTLRPIFSNGAGQLVRGPDVVAKAGDDVTLFGGAGADGTLVVCSVEEIHSSP